MASTVLAVKLGERIRKLRTERGWSQRDLARRASIASKSVISYYELGERFPTYETLLRLADVFGVSTDYLLRGKDEDIRIKTGSLNVTQLDALMTIINSMQQDEKQTEV